MASQRGIAMIWWVIVLLVLFLAAAGYAYDRYAADEEKALRIAQLKEKNGELIAANQAEIEKRRELSQYVGYTDGGSQSQPSAIAAAIDRLKQVFVDSDQDGVENTLQAMVNRAEQKIAIVSRRLSDEESKVKQARDNEDAARQSAQNTIQEKDAALRTSLAEKQTVETNLSNTTRTKDQEIESLRERIAQKDEEVAKIQKDSKERIRVVMQERDRLAAQVKEVATHYASVRQNDGPDGRITARAAGGNTVWVNVGSRHGLKAGTQFEVFEYVKGNIPRRKGQIVIQEVEANQARAALIAEVDRYDPVATGDNIRNPLFESNKTPKFYLLGDMTGRWSNQQTAAMIQDMGGEVVTEVSANVDFVVVGRRESGLAVPFESRPEWEKIQNFKLEIIDTDYLEKYFGK